MYHNPSYDKYRIRERHRRIYVLTKTQMFIGFVVSVFFSIFFGAYFERYGHLLLKHIEGLAASAIEGGSGTLSASDSSAPIPTEKPRPKSIEERLREIEVRSSKAPLGRASAAPSASERSDR